MTFFVLANVTDDVYRFRLNIRGYLFLLLAFLANHLKLFALTPRVFCSADRAYIFGIYF